MGARKEIRAVSRTTLSRTLWDVTLVATRRKRKKEGKRNFFFYSYITLQDICSVLD